MATYELAPEQKKASGPSLAGFEGLGSSVLIQNALWFTHIRWVVVMGMAAFGLLNLWTPSLLTRAGLIPQGAWPWGLAGLLAAVNGLFVLQLRRLSADSPGRWITGSIWAQIVVDLLILTLLVHRAGPLDTFIGFAYLFHIVLACIFFTPRKSLSVALLSAVLFVAVVSLQATGVIPKQSIVVDAVGHSRQTSMVILWTLSALFIWFGVWYLAATIARTVRRRDRELAIANENLRQADKERTLQVLRVTHDLRAPFSGIESNIQLLRFQHWEEIPESVRHLIDRIQVRAQTLAERIRDILTLGDLRSSDRPVIPSPVELNTVVQQAIDGLLDTATARRITVRVDVPPMHVSGEHKPLVILFANLISNAIFYSHEGGEIDVRAVATPREVCVGIQDHGIGIKDEALPRIFEEFFRTREAASFNSRSTGLGLPIVGTIARKLGLRIRVNSEEDKGTLFEVFLRPATKADGTNPTTNREEAHHD